MTAPDYAELHCMSNFSFLRGASHPEALVERAAHLGYRALALTDECSLAGVVRAHLAAKQHAVQLIIGTQMHLTTPEGAPHAHLVVLATNRAGYGQLSEWITRARMRADKGRYCAYPNDLAQYPLPGCVFLLIHDFAQPVQQMLTHAQWLQHHCPGRAWLAAENLLRATDSALIEHVRQVATATGLPIVASGDVRMHVRSAKTLLDIQTATRLGQPLSACGLALSANAEHYLRPRPRLAQLYPPEWLAQTIAIAARCHFSLNELRYEYPQELVPDGYTPASHLRALTEAGAQRRFPHGVPAAVQALIEKELQLITELNYEPYFLTVEDLVRFARARGILCQGRGSAANSVVCYCLGITEVDPRRCHMLIERFISRERNEPPDIDVDFEHQRREEVIQYLYAKYGRTRVALTATVIRYRRRSALRDVGKALGFASEAIDHVTQNLRWDDPPEQQAACLQQIGLDAAAPAVTLWLTLAHALRGTPRHLSQHVGGFVIARDSLAQLVPIENAAMQGRSVIEWDKDDLDALGLLKVDVLALGMLSALRRALGMIGDKLGQAFTLADIPDDDAPTFDMICAADTIGAFQIESRAQMSMLPRLKPRCYYDLVVQVAIVRPGPIQGGMVHPYLRRRNGQEPVDYEKDEIRSVLERTYGVPIFQEQVIQLAVVAAEFTPGEADALRRGMAAWKRSGDVGPFRERLTSRMQARGYSAEFAQRIYRQIEGFGEYGFPESHAASFALLAYASCWIKCHHPDAFLVALLNSQPLGFYAPAQLIADARRHGVTVRAVDVATSDVQSTLEPMPHASVCAVRLGLDRIHGLAHSAMMRIVEARQTRALTDIEDLAQRAQLNTQQLDALAASGALNSFAGHRRQARWQALGTEVKRPPVLRDARFTEPELQLPAASEGEALVADYARLGFTLGRHPLALLRPKLKHPRLRTAAQLAHTPHGARVQTCGLVTHRQRPHTAGGTVFISLEDETGPINVIVWRKVFERHRPVAEHAQLLTVQGTWQNVEGVRHVLAHTLTDHSALLGQLTVASRDFR